MTLHTPRGLQAQGTLAATGVPILCLVDALAEKGWEPKWALCNHGPGLPLEYDARGICGKRRYLQVLLLGEEVWRRGVLPFRSDVPQGWLALLLRGQWSAPPGLAAGEYARRLAALKGECCPAQLERPPPPPRQEPIQPAAVAAGLGRQRHALVGAGSEEDSDIACDTAPGLEPPGAGAAGAAALAVLAPEQEESPGRETRPRGCLGPAHAEEQLLEACPAPLA